MTTQQVGMTLYELAIALTVWLLVRVVRSRHYREYPVFTGYLAFVVVKSSLGFVLKAAGFLQTYWLLYRSTRPIVFVLTAAIAAEALRHAYKSVRVERGLQFAAVVPSLTLAVGFSFNLDRALRVLLILATFACIARLRTIPTPALGILLGTFAMELLPAIAGSPHMLASSPAASYSTTFGYILGLAVWLTYIPREQRPA